ncbi:hypothetical protein AVEN_216457-1 [Araneus ventricosus]|uniref:Retrotransposon gag domain-containing protein n=1 Tax=Araneus ventricosus TaxID=182803 RepID=A0A4Y2BPI5_ARAVE|nr:hypothetical protein AVEN_216457-1 [Araneus ventricosus]
MPTKDKRSKRTRDAAELSKQYEISEIFPSSADLLNEIPQQHLQVEVLKNRQLQQPFSQIDSNIAEVLNTLMESQKQFLERQINSPNVIQITSTNDTANSIKIFQGDTTDNASECIKEVYRILALANWTNELKLTNAILRLARSAKNWQITQGYRYNDWSEWKTTLASRFKRGIIMQDFLAHQSDRKLKRNESLVD